MVAPSYIDYLLNRWLIGWDSFKEFNSKIIGFSVTMIDTPYMDQIYCTFAKKKKYKMAESLENLYSLERKP